MGDPYDFRLGGGWHSIPREIYGTLEDMTKAVERLLTLSGDRLTIPELKAKKKQLAKASRILTKYEERVRPRPAPTPEDFQG